MASVEEIVDRGNRAFNDHDIDALVALYADDAELVSAGNMRLRGREQIEQFTRAWIQGFPDCSTTTERRIVSGNVVVEEAIFRGTHTGVFPTPMGDIPPTGRSVEGQYVDIFTIENGKVVSDHLLFDRMQLMEQLGLVPAGVAG